MWRFKENVEDTYTRLRLALYFSHQKYQKKKQKSFWVRSKLSKRKILSYTSLSYFTFELLDPCPPRPETSLQTAKLATKQKPFDLYRPATGLLSVAENTNKLQKCVITVAELLQICSKTMSSCFVFVSSI